MRHRAFVRLARSVAVLAVAGVVVAGNSAGASTRAAKPTNGGTLQYLFNTEPPGLLPEQLREIPNITPTVVQNGLYDSLVYADPVTLKVKPKMATSLTTADKGLTWILKLHSGITFSDGTPFDAAAVQFNWQRIADPANRAAFAQYAQQVAAYETPDPLTLKVTLKAADVYWDQWVARALSWIGSPTALKASTQNFSTKPVAAGPYMLKDWVRGVSMTFVKNPNYWVKGEPHIDQIDFKTINDDAARASTMLTGGAQVTLDGAWGNITQYKDAGKYAITNTPSTGGGYALVMNMSRPPFNDLRVRQAIQLTVDSKEVIERTGDGDDSWVIKTVDEKTSPYYNSKLKLPKNDPVAAQKLVDAYVAEKGPIDFSYLVLNVPTHVRIANAVQTILQSKLKNVKVNLEILNPAEGVPKYTAGNFQFMLNDSRWTEPALDMPARNLSTSATNYMKWNNPTVDAAIKTLTTTTDQKQKQQAHDTVIEQALEEVPYVWIERFRTFYAYDKTQVKGWDMVYELRPFLEQLWLAKPKG